MAVDEHEARPAQAGAAAEPRAGQAEIVAQDIEAGRIRVAADRPLDAVDGQPDVAFLRVPASGGVDGAHSQRVCIRLHPLASVTRRV